MADVELFRVRAMHFEGYAPGVAGKSNKVWAAVILKRPSTDGRSFCYLSVWGPTGGTMQSKQQPWTYGTQANERFEKAVTKQEREGYRFIDWKEERWGLVEAIRKLERSVPESVASGDAARKAWQTRKETAAEKRANDALAGVKLSEDTPPPPAQPKPEPPRAVPRMRSLRRGMEDLLK